jgi:hypothetical protein
VLSEYFFDARGRILRSSLRRVGAVLEAEENSDLPSALDERNRNLNRPFIKCRIRLASGNWDFTSPNYMNEFGAAFPLTARAASIVLASAVKLRPFKAISPKIERSRKTTPFADIAINFNNINSHNHCAFRCTETHEIRYRVATKWLPQIQCSRVQDVARTEQITGRHPVGRSRKGGQRKVRHSHFAVTAVRSWTVLFGSERCPRLRAAHSQRFSWG